MELFGKEEILALAQPWVAPRYCGVYFLIKDSEIIYVGKSTNVPNRLVSHRQGEERKDFDSYVVISCQESEVDQLEDAYIGALTPQLNVRGPRKPKPPRKESKKEAFERMQKERRERDIALAAGWYGKSAGWPSGHELR